MDANKSSVGGTAGEKGVPCRKEDEVPESRNLVNGWKNKDYAPGSQ